MKVSQLNALAKIAYDKTNPYEHFKHIFNCHTLLFATNAYMLVTVECRHDFKEPKDVWRILDLDGCKEVENNVGYVDLNNAHAYIDEDFDFTSRWGNDYFDKFFQKAPDYALKNELSDLVYNPEYLYKLINVFKVFKVFPSVTLLDGAIPVYSGQNKNYGIKAILYPARR